MATPRNAWHDKFSTPEVVDLIGEVNATHRPVFEAARDRLLQIAGVQEDLRWMGVPWRWCLAYLAKSAPERPIAYLIPEPAKPTMSVPLTGRTLSNTQVKSLSRLQREALVNGTRVGEVVWTNWELVSKTVLGEAMGMVELKMTACAPQPAAAVS